MGSKERNKGARGELMLRDKINAHGFDVHRGFTFHHESDVVGLPGIHIECKFVEKLNVRGAYKQATEEAEKRQDGEPAVFWKKSREKWLTIVDSDFFLELLKKASMTCEKQ